MMIFENKRYEDVNTKYSSIAVCLKRKSGVVLLRSYSHGNLNVCFPMKFQSCVARLATQCPVLPMYPEPSSKD